MRTWYNIKAKDDGTTEISIYDEIGGWGVNARSFIDALKAVGDKSEVLLTINSPGGSVFDALAMYNALRNSGKTIKGRVMGVAASAASLVLMACDTIEMPENTFLMIHNPMGGVFGNADEMRDWADTLDKIASSLVATYSARSGKTAEEVKALLDAETWMTADEAVKMGFADVVQPALKVSAAFEVDRLPANIRAAFDAAQSDDPVEDPAVDPVADPVPEQPPFAQAVEAAATAAGLGEFAAVFALDVKLTTIEAVATAINQAREVQALCALVKKPEMASQLIHGRVTMPEVRSRLCAMLAEEDERTTVDTAVRSNRTPVASAKPGPITTASIWAARNK